MFKRVVKRYWSKRSKTYDKAPGHSGYENIWYKILKLVIKYYGRTRGKCLDIGCGTGFMTKILINLGFHVVCLDISLEMLKQAKEKLRNFTYVEFIEADAERLPIRSRSIDLIVSRHIVWTLQDPATAVGEWIRVLKNNGINISFDGTWHSNNILKKFSKILINTLKIVINYKVEIGTTLRYNLVRLFRGENIEVIRKLLRRIKLDYKEVNLTSLRKLLTPGSLYRDYLYYMIIIRKSKRGEKELP